MRVYVVACESMMYIYMRVYVVVHACICGCAVNDVYICVYMWLCM